MMLRFALFLPLFACHSLVNALDQHLTNRNADLGYLPAPQLQKCLNNDCTPGKVREYTFEVTQGYLAPDGVNTTMLLVNGASPGPLIEANVGDTFKIRVINKIDDHQGTAIHWHGLFQKDTPWMDGVPSVSFCPITPGEEFTYEFKADRVGTSWWHSHYSAQTVAGLLGPMIIYGESLPYTYDKDLGPVLLSDHLHFDYRQMVDTVLKGLFSPSSNMLINGKMDYNCSAIPAGGPSCTPDAGFAKFRFYSGKKHLLRLINSAGEALQHFTIDGHKFTVVGLDYTPIKPYETDMISLSPGQRADIIVQGHTESKNGSFWMRSDANPTCSGSGQPHAKAIVLYDNASEDVLPTTSATQYTLSGNCEAQLLSQTEPLQVHSPPAGGPTYTQVFDWNLVVGNFPPNASAQFLVNDRQFRANYSQALLSITNEASDAASANEQYGLLSNVWDFGENKTLRIVVYNHHPSPHPMHLHGHDFWILAEGRGTWDGSLQGNPQNPMRRDTHQMIGASQDGTPSYLVIEFELDNPGVWAFHCHISLHLVLGMYMNLVYGQDQIRKYQIPPSIEQNCALWRDYEKKHPVGQPDSGL